MAGAAPLFPVDLDLYFSLLVGFSIFAGAAVLVLIALAFFFSKP